MRGVLVFILLAFYGLSGAFAQNLYQSLEGHVLVSGKYEGETILAESHRLNLFLDYTTKEFRGKLDLGTLDTGIDSLNAKLAAIKPAQVFFSGVIPDDDFITWEHPELEFDIPLTVQLAGEKLNPLLGIKLNHYRDSNTYACLLSGTMNLPMSVFENRLGGFSDMFDVKFTQVLMRRDR